MNTVVLFFLIISNGHGLTTIPEPFATEAACKAAVKQVNASQKEGGLPGMWGHCVRVEARKAQ